MTENEIEKELNRLNHYIAQYSSEIEQLPEGKLIVSQNNVHNHIYSKWYVNHTGHKDGTTYLSQDNENNYKLAEKLARKKYLTCILKESIAQRNALSTYLRHLRKAKEGSQKILANSDYRKLLKSSFIPQQEELKMWVSEEYIPNPYHPEGRKFPSPSGHILRSKSETIIDMALSMHKIPFRYESPLQIDQTIYYPDFTIRHPETGQFYYWEHFGLVDQQDYLNGCLQKLRCYIRNGIIPTVNLITTYESNEYPLSPALIEALIQYYFL